MIFSDASARRSAIAQGGLFIILAAAVGNAGAQLVVNEIDYDQPGSDFAEFVELKNISGAVVNLDAYTVELVNGNGGTVYQTVDLPNVDLDAGEFYVLCENAATVPACDLDILNQVQNGSPDAVAIRNGGTVVDTVSYEGNTVAPYTEGSGAGLVDDNGAAFMSISRIPDGTDTDVNNVDLQATCITPGFANTPENTNCMAPPEEKVVVNEVDYDQGATDGAEFIELYNSGNQDVALASLEVQLVNGTTGAIENSILPGAGNFAAGAYFVICVNAASTANCDLDVGAATDFIGDAGPRAVALRQNGILIDTLSYGGNSIAPYTEGTGAGSDNPATTDSGLSRFPNGTDSDNNAADFSERCITPGQSNTAVSGTCGGGAGVEIFAIQGSGLASPLDGQVVTTNDNIVTAVGPDGFYMQTPTARSDGDPETAEGIFVFTGGTPTVAVGDQVDVTGTVDEFFDLTEMTGSPLVSIDSSGNALPAPVVFDATTPSPNQPQPDNELERYEGMLVSSSGIATGASDRFGDVRIVATEVRTYREPGITYPGLPGLPVYDGNPQVFDLNPDDLSLPDEAVFATQAYTAIGPLSYAFGDYSLVPTSLSLGPVPALPRGVREAMPGEMTIATYNMLRFFDTVDDPLIDDTVETPEDFAARLEKFSSYIRVTLATPDIIAVQEVENLASLQALADQLAADEPGLVYSAFLVDGNDVGGIDVGYLTRDATVTVNSVTRYGEDLILDFDGSLLFDRPPLILDAVYTGNGADFPVTVINLHQRSLGGIDGNEAERVRTKRFEQAFEVATLAQDLQTANPEIHLVVTGDFNAYEFTDGYVDVTGQITGVLDPLGDEFDTVDIVNPDLRNHVLDLPAEERYSFIFDGSAQALDHTASSITLNAFFRDAAFARGNADAPNSLLLATGPDIGLRVSDHDALVVYYMTDADGDGLADDQDNCILVENPDQVDSNKDGIGNRCDADIAQPNDCFVNFLDLTAISDAFFTNPSSPAWNPDADMIPDGSINFLDLDVISDQFFSTPGPSASGCN